MAAAMLASAWPMRSTVLGGDSRGRAVGCVGARGRRCAGVQCGCLNRPELVTSMKLLPIPLELVELSREAGA